MSDVCEKCPHAEIDHGPALGCMSCSCIFAGAPEVTEPVTSELDPTPEPEEEEPSDEDSDEDDESAE